MNSITRSLMSVALAALTVAACDVRDPLEGVDLRIDVTDQPVATNATLAIRQGQSAVVATTVEIGGDIEEITELKRIKLDPAFVSFVGDAAAGSLRASSAAITGTIDVAVLIDAVPVPGTPVRVTVVDNVVTAIDPMTIEFDGVTYDKAGIEALIAAVPESERPALPASWGSLTAAEAVDLISRSLESESIELSIVAYSGDLSGSLRLDQFTIDAEVAAALQ